MTKANEGSQATTDDPKPDEEFKDDGEIIYGADGKEKPKEKEEAKPKEGEKEEPNAEEKAAAAELKERAEKAGLKEDATEEEIAAAEKAAEKPKEEDKPKASVIDLQDAAQKAIETWQANPTPENKKLADEAVSAAKKAVEDVKKAEIKYEVKLPEKTLLPQQRLEEIVSYARERGFSNEVAQAMVDRENQAVISYNQDLVKQVDKMVNEDWPNEAKDDKEIGGDNFAANAELSKRVINKFGTEEFKDLLDPRSKENPEGKGYGNHPELMRFCVRIARAMSDDQLVIQKDGGSKEKKIEDVFYGDQPSENKDE